MNVGVVVIIFLLVLSFLGVPIFIALGIGTLVALHMADMALIVLPQKLFAGMNSSSLLAIPFFILAGSLMSRSITEKLINIANALIGQIKGSLGVVTVLSSTLFGAISGSGVATASAIGGITIPAMKKSGYPDEFATAISSISSIFLYADFLFLSCFFFSAIIVSRVFFIFLQSLVSYRFFSLYRSEDFL